MKIFNTVIANAHKMIPVLDIKIVTTKSPAFVSSNCRFILFSFASSLAKGKIIKKLYDLRKW